MTSVFQNKSPQLKQIAPLIFDKLKVIRKPLASTIYAAYKETMKLKYFNKHLFS